MKRKYLLSHILCVIFIILPALSAAVFSVELESHSSPPSASGEWLYFDKGTGIAVCGYTGNDEHITVPETIEGKTVESLCNNPFDASGQNHVIIENSFFRSEEKSASRSITIPSTVKTIGAFTFFACASLKEVNLSQGLTDIYSYAFAYCINLCKADIPDGTKSIGNCAFSKTGITSLDLPDTIINIGDSAFESTPVSQVELPDNLTSLGNGAFSGCKQLKSAKLPSTLTKIPYKLFEDCEALQSVIMPDSLKAVDSYAFQNCAELKEIKLPSGLTEISNGAFTGCQALKSIEIPDTVEYMGESVFSFCGNLENIKLPSGITKIAIKTFLNCRSLKVIEIPEGVREIGWSIGAKSFEGCESLEEIHLPKSIRSVYNILQSNRSLKDVYFAADKDVSEALFGADIISVMAAEDYSGTDYGNVELHFGKRELVEITWEKTPLDIIKEILKITSIIFAAAFLIALALNLIQKIALKPKKADRGGNVLTKYNSSDMITCKHCGTASGREAKYCYSCGKKLSHRFSGSGRRER